MFLFFLSFAFFSFVVVFNKPISQFTRAKEELSPSISRSRMIAWPFPIIPADGETKSTIHVFVVSETDRPLQGKVVTLTTTHGTLYETSATSDANGKATFSISAETPGIATLQAIVEPDVQLANQISLKFE